MSDNKGKDGEMVVARALCDIAIAENKVDYTRSSITNAPDLGADLVLHCPENTGDKFEDIVNEGSSSMELSGRQIEIRIDVKAKKVEKEDAEKFIGDIVKHPTKKEHWITGDAISGPAKNIISECDWIKTRFLSNNDIQKIANYYQGLNKPEE